MNSKSIASCFVWNHQHFEKLAKLNIFRDAWENDHSFMYKAPSSDHSLLTLILPFKVLLRKFEVVWKDWSKFIQIHQYYTTASIDKQKRIRKIGVQERKKCHPVPTMLQWWRRVIFYLLHTLINVDTDDKIAFVVHFSSFFLLIFSIILLCQACSNDQILCLSFRIESKHTWHLHFRTRKVFWLSDCTTFL